MVAFVMSLFMLATGFGGVDTHPNVFFDGEMTYGSYDHAIVRIYSNAAKPRVLLWTSDDLYPDDTYEVQLYWDNSGAEEDDPFTVECTLYDDHNQPESTQPIPITGIDWPSDFLWVSGFDYYCTNDF